METYRIYWFNGGTLRKIIPRKNHIHDTYEDALNYINNLKDRYRKRYQHVIIKYTKPYQGSIVWIENT